ncbi:MAG: efflux RND transporter periplasmic adaptor subunit [Planctomycetota bacterium]
MPVAIVARSPRSTVLCLALAGLTTACGKAAAPAPTGRPPAVVSVATAEAVDVPLYIDEIGRCVATEVVAVQPRVSGQVVEVLVKDGQDVEEDATLFRIDPRPYDAALAQAKAREAVADAAAKESRTAVATAQARVGSARSRLLETKAKIDATRAGIDEMTADVEAADAEVARAEDDLARFEKVSPAGGVSGQELDRARTAARGARARAAAARTRRVATGAQVREVEAAVATAQDGILEAESLATEAAARVVSADAEVERAKATVAAAQLDVDFCTVKAPIAGRAGRRLVDKGNIVAAGAVTLITLQRHDPLYAEFSVTEDDLTRVQSRTGGRPLTVEVILPDEAGPPRTGPLTFVDNAVDPATGTVRLRASLSNPDHRFWPGRFVKVRLVLETLKGAVLVPASAPMATAQGVMMIVVTPEQKADIRPVALGQRHGDRVVVTQGVDAGDRVVVAGQLGAMSGATLVIEAPPQTPTGSPGAAPPGGAGMGR